MAGISQENDLGKSVRVIKWLGMRLVRLTVLFLILTIPVCCVIVQVTGSSAAAEHKADPELLKQEVKALTQDFGPRYSYSKANLAACRQYLRDKLEACGAQVEEQAYEIDQSKYFNLRAFFGDKSLPRIVVGAHYDTCLGTSGGDKPGADDNASGVVGLLGLARMLEKEPPRDVCVELVAYCTEEPPYFATRDMGSWHHARALARERVKVKGVLVLEMIGFFSDAPHSQSYPTVLFNLVYPTTANFIAIVGGMPDRSLIATCKKAMQGSTPLPVTSSCIPRFVDFVHLSDHRNYWPFAMNAVMITDTSFYRNPNYHHATDTWQTLDYVRMAQVVTGVHRAVLAMAQE